MRREATQLGFFALLTALAPLADSRALSVIAAIVDLVGLALAAVAALVAWRAGGKRVAVLVYVVAALIFAALAVLNLRH